MAGDGNDGRFVVAGFGLLAAEDAGDEFADHEYLNDGAPGRSGKARILPQSNDFPAHFAGVGA